MELLVVIGIAATMSLIAAPKLSNLYRQYQLASALNQLGADIGRARTTAVAQGRFVRVRLSSSNGYVIERSSNGVLYTQIGGTIKLPSPVVIPYSAGSPTFNRSGMSTAITLIPLSNGIITRNVRTNRVGRVSIE